MPPPEQATTFESSESRFTHFMIQAFANSAETGPIAVLLHPSIVPVIDVFRSLGSLDDQYDLALLDEPEQALAAYARPETAKGVVSDALLLAFALTRQRGRPFQHRPLGSRHATMDEYCLMALLVSSRSSAPELGMEAAVALGVGSVDFMSSLAGELIRQFNLGFLTFSPPSVSEFRAVVSNQRPPEGLVYAERDLSGFHFRI